VPTCDHLRPSLLGEQSTRATQLRLCVCISKGLGNIQLHIKHGVYEALKEAIVTRSRASKKTTTISPPPSPLPASAAAPASEQVVLGKYEAAQTSRRHRSLWARAGTGHCTRTRPAVPAGAA